MAGKQEGKKHADHIFIEKVYDRILRERGMRREYDIEVDKWFAKKDNSLMKTGGNKLVT